MDSSEVARVVGSGMTVSDKIRALDAAGYSRAEIARLLGKRYQHVRNVLEADKALAATRPASDMPEDRAVFSTAEMGVSRGGVAEARAPFPGIWRLQLENDGVVRLPGSVLTAIGLKAGSVLICELEGEVFKILSPRAAAERARSFLTGLPSVEERSLVDELIAERRAEAAREDADG